MSDRYMISEISFENIKGLRSLKLEDIGDVLQLTGANGTCKSSVLRGFKGGLGLEGDINNIKNVEAGDEPAEIDYFLSDGKDPKRFRVRRRGGKATIVEERVAGTQGYEKVKRPAEFVDALIDRHLIDPGDFVRAEPKRQVDLFLQALPLELAPEQVREALGGEKYAEVSDVVERGDHPLKVLAAVHDALYNTRTGLNTSLRKSKDAAEKMKLSIPEHLDASEPAAVASLETERDELAAALADSERRITDKYKDADREMVSDFTAFASKRKARLAEDIAKLQADATIEIDAERSVMAAGQAAASKMHDTALAALQADRDALATMKEKLAAARAQADNATRFRTLQEQADNFEKEAEGLDTKARGYTAALEALAGLKAKLLETAPVPGLTVDDDGVKINKVPINELNTQQLTDLGVLVAIMRAKKKTLPIAILDNAEMYDKAHRAAIVERFREAGVQVLISFVSEGELRIVQEEEA